MNHLPEVSITRFNPSDQAAVRQLILDGLAGHFGELDPDLNPDLDDIAAHYSQAVFLVARAGDRIAGCGALVPLDGEAGEIVRMSVRREMRRQGIGRRVLEKLAQEARTLGLSRLVLETNVDWADVRRFYESYGFAFTHEQDHRFGRQAHYQLILADSRVPGQPT